MNIVYVLIRDNFGKVSVDSVYSSEAAAKTAEQEREREKRAGEDSGGYVSMVSWRIAPFEVNE